MDCYMVFCFLIFAMFYIWGEGLGPGDVKLMGAVGAFLGWPGAITALALTAISGGFFAILLLAIKGKLLSTIKRAVLLLVFTFSPQRRQKLWQQSEKIYLPYGPAIFLGTMLTVVGKHFG